MKEILPIEIIKSQVKYENIHSQSNKQNFTYAVRATHGGEQCLEIVRSVRTVCLLNYSPFQTILH